MLTGCSAASSTPNRVITEALVTRLLWFIGLWLASVAAIGAVALVLRWLIVP